jgi:hypothetical protein
VNLKDIIELKNEKILKEFKTTSKADLTIKTTLNKVNKITGIIKIASFYLGDRETKRIFDSSNTSDCSYEVRELSISK